MSTKKKSSPESIVRDIKRKILLHARQDPRTAGQLNQSHRALREIPLPLEWPIGRTLTLVLQKLRMQRRG